MKQIVFISGKGGTGKSTVVASLSRIVQNKMLADCDVDAPNLHLILQGETVKKDDFYGADVAVIDPALCVRCGRCRETCRFDAISEDYQVQPMRCEGCGACTLVCPQKAISLETMKTGETYVSRTPQGTFSHALLDIGAEGSGKLVTEVKKNLPLFEKEEDWALVDGSPGIGCAVIASITGADAVVAVTEPTQTGKIDLERVLELARHFGISAFVCINKFDLNEEVTRQIEKYCAENGFPVIGRIPFEPAVVRALQALKTPVEAGIASVTAAIEEMWNVLELWNALRREMARLNRTES